MSPTAPTNSRMKVVGINQPQQAWVLSVESYFMSDHHSCPFQLAHFDTASSQH
ncbi:hypothetical protein PCANC_04888 [Puccinia coronata f. sp. avenae]|uniref:Uncharacterized protein n=1 Tax=Puccinia coronata f. sp. avenae TaxID=200324 RepID=A0A2N5VWL7_9BASI|nr:hypothetical protein PCASD_03372 [Puccinia coronata f. sp. avenae]PLW54352.1 hypothetical protein PCANC_04888 [Puccinia coronata f. sp. avenae]